MSDLESRITALSPAKRALLEQRLRDKAQQQDTGPIQPRSSSTKPPLSFGQQRFWFLNHWEPGNPAYNTSMVLRIEGPLDASVMDRSLTEISRRHEALRTTFVADGDTPVQIIHPAGPIEARRIDGTGASSEDREAETTRWMAEDASRPFDMVNGPIWRAALLQVEPHTHVLLLTVHHIVFDGWSMGLLQRELLTLYEAFTAGRDSPLSDLPIQYADFAIWQRRRLQGDLLANQLGYWRGQLSDLSTLDLPTDHPRPAIQTFTGALHQMHLPPRLAEALRALSRREGATLFMTLLAAFQVLLHRYSGQNDIVVGTPIAGRTRVEVEELIGFFVNMLVLRSDLSGDPTFRELLGKVRTVAFEAYANQDIPFEKLVEELHPRRDPSRNPLFQLVFALQNAPRAAALPGRLKVTRLNNPRASTRFDLEVHFHEIEGGLKGAFIYNTELFDAGTIARMTEHFRVLLDAIEANPDQRLSELPLLTREERHRALVEWNQTATDYPSEACIHGLFEARVRTAPDALAVAFGAQQLTYAQLNDRANQLAHHLGALGVGPDGLVGVYLEPSIEMVVGVLGILKAGAAYVPLEPSYPRERIAFMLEDAKLSVLLTQETLRSKLPETRVPIVSLDAEHLEHNRADNPDNTAAATSLAYVMYTSGSTGRPKGVSVPHRAVVRLVVNTNYVQLGPSDRIAQASNPSFDAASFEFWGALLNGAALIGIPQAVLLSPRDFARAIQEHQISTLFLTTALFNQMASEVPTAFQSLRYLLVGGEACDPKWVRTMLEYGSPQCFINGYGPTESATFATYHRVRSVPDGASSIPIGRPIANTRVYLLDRSLQPVPVGVPGELHIGGAGLAREYLNRPELTAEKFIRDPFDGDPSARLYRTGDFARYLPDGSIDFIGRVDGQLKIRGFRIELQEIEATLSRHPEVRQSVVIARSKNQGDIALVAYVVPADGKEISMEALRQFLRETLPEYMVPSAFVKLESVPLTANGKVDHAALPEPALDRHEREPTFAEPRSSIEKDLARIWEGLLGVRRVGIHDNFFDLGGHSLLAIQLIARIEKRFGKRLPVAVLFQFPTIEQLAGIVTDPEEKESWSSVIPLQAGGSRAPFFWIHGDSSNARLAEYLGPDRPLYALEHQAHDGRPALYTEVETIAAYYLREVRRIRPQGPYLLGGYSFGAAVAFEVAHQLSRDGEEVAELFLLDPPGQAAPSTPSSGRFHRHVRELARLDVREKLLYVSRGLAARVRDEVSSRTAPITNRVKRLRWKAHISKGQLLPASLRSPYILELYRKAIRSYSPASYSGRVTIFRTENTTYRAPLNWVELSTGSLEIHEAPGGHMDLTKEPFLAVWAPRLKDSLDRAG